VLVFANTIDIAVYVWGFGHVRNRHRFKVIYTYINASHPTASHSAASHSTASHSTASHPTASYPTASYFVTFAAIVFDVNIMKQTLDEGVVLDKQNVNILIFLVWPTMKTYWTQPQILLPKPLSMEVYSVNHSILDRILFEQTVMQT
jgi:hypothetical protein